MFLGFRFFGRGGHMFEIIGMVGSIAFALSGVPAAYHALRDRHCAYPWGFLILWGIGEILCSIYALHQGADILVWFNYVPNFLCLCILGYFNRRTSGNA
jgi:hypothetical protein